MGLFKRKPRQVIFIMYAEGKNQRFSRRALVDIYNEKEINKEFFNWINKQVEEISQFDTEIVPRNLIIIK